ncbi:TFIIB-type zinc finger domain-containing protein [Pseudoruegeria sp. SHC-113]|uniref:TFIIB-type zinc finger domain-containing protein n=1 Tax=Pseudoruegeria sp. SHC-113 TaxID=2855439 RepID=UPI0021BA8382|nr:TFIIB-type zinc finger domain-containing protein [Pseudoruegeria sp. SHC-113]MCT8159596.1 TFIIB-type zinc finger domain-containing protein [Pseudoruegeria sp. SHC-113]
MPGSKHLKAQEERPEVEDHRFPCPSCGSDLRYSPVEGQLQCDHCGFTEAIEGTGRKLEAIKELDFQQALRDMLPEAEIEETRVITCESCGAQVEFSEETHAAECPFCASPVVTDTGAHRHIKPRGVIPFVVEERAAHKAMNDWLGRLWFAPNGLQEYARKGRKLEGIYVPYWTYDADTKSRYTGQRGTYYYVTRTVVVDGKTQQRQERKIRWSPAAGRVARFFDDVLVLASRSLPKSYTDALEPWDLSLLEPYQAEYLAGMRAEGYQVQLDEGFHEARARMDRVIERDVKFDIGGDVQRIQSLDTAVSDITFKHILLPVWMAAYKYRGKTYRFVVNGQSGRVQGERPYSTWKILLAAMFALSIAAVIGYFAAQNG